MMQLNLTAPINQLGYGVAGVNILKALWEEGVEVSLFPIGGKQNVQVASQEDYNVVAKSIDLAENCFNPNAASVRIWHQNQLAQHVGRGPHIGFPIFELDTFTKQERHHLFSQDHLFVCSEWARQIVLDHSTWESGGEYATPWGDKLGEDDITVVPLGVDENKFPTVLPQKKDKIVFFNCGKWEVRKGHDILIDAFRQAYEHCPNIELWMMCTNPFNTPQEEAKWQNKYRHPAVKLIPRAETQDGVYNIMAQTDCGVFPSRGEGWNLELLEMMAVGRHVIATNYSAHTQFCTHHNARLVDVAGLEPAHDGKWFFGQGQWAKLNENTIEDLALAMRDFATHYDFSLNKEGVETAGRFTWRKSAWSIIEKVKQLTG